MNRVYNFSSGPAQLPYDVLVKAQAELLDYNSTGMSVMEMSHRSAAYKEIIENAEKNLRKLYNISDEYAVLFLQGGASLQFAMIPMNFNKIGSADYIDSGYWSAKAIKEAKKFTNVRVVCSTKEENYNRLPDFNGINFEGDYVYMTSNNTIYGTHYSKLPETGNVPLVADLSSCICSEPIDVSKYGLIFAGAQKNLGPAGVTIVIIREDLISEPMEFTPTMLRYDIHAKNNSLYNTPPCYGIYMCKLMFEWLKNDIGGLENMAKINRKKADILYSYLDSSKLFKPTVQGDSRSMMNVPFVTGDADLDAKFVKEAAAAGFVNLKGHRTVGGMRASIYNAMPVEGVEALVEFMKKFEAENA